MFLINKLNCESSVSLNKTYNNVIFYVKYIDFCLNADAVM